jgi:hypothetical protein
MDSLRTAHRLAKLVLAWFVLSIGVAMASPIVLPQRMELLCAGSGITKLLVKTADGTEAAPSHGVHCALCVQASAPPPARPAAAVPPHPLSYAAQAATVSRTAVRTAAPPPGRGPPLL